MQLSFTPTPDREEARLRLERLLVPGSLLDPYLAGRIDRLARAFASFVSSYPLPLWAPGLVTDNEMRGLSEALFPMDGVRPLFDLLLRRGCRFEPFLTGSYLHSSATWLDLLQRLQPPIPSANPATLLLELARDHEARTRFLFSLMLPHHFGGGFDRYPQQSLWLSSWLRERMGRFPGGIRVLDSACGSGEGTYQVAGLVAAAGPGGRGSEVHGSTLEQIELFAAAHMFFPHDLDRVGSAPVREPYHLVLCNGLLGGPLMHDPGQLACAFAGLAARLAPGGVLVAADRFHAGWRLRVPVGTLTALMRQHGLTPLEVPEGIAGVKAG